MSIVNLDIARRRDAELTERLRALDAQAGDRRLDRTQQAEWDAVTAEQDEIRALIKAQEEADAKAKVLADARARWGAVQVGPAYYTTHPAPMADRASDGKGYLSLRGLAPQVRAAAERQGEFSLRALLAAGSTATAPAILTETPVSLGKPATALLDLIPARTIKGAEYGYLRQTARTNNAAPVAVGGQKPTSVATLTRISGTLNVVAHLSEPIHEMWINDAPSLEQFISEEMATGIASALEDELLNGTGVAPSLNGIIATATGTQAYATSPVVTIRTAIAQLEAAGLIPSGIVLASSDWLAIETATVTGGAYLLGDGATGAPLDRIKRTLWGVPVVVSTAHTAGTAVLLSRDSVGLVTDGGVQFSWGRIGSDFEYNQIRGRAELRAEVEVYRPAGIIVCDLTA